MTEKFCFSKMGRDVVSTGQLQVMSVIGLTGVEGKLDDEDSKGNTKGPLTDTWSSRTS